MRLTLCSIALFGLMTASVQASTVMLPSFSTLSGDQEVPPVTTSASGTASFTLDPISMEILNLDLNVTGISTAELFDIGSNGPVHIHDGDFGENGGIVVPFTTGFSDTADGFSLQVASMMISQDALDALQSSNGMGAYFNVHTQEFNSGEIRGQITVTPVPAAFPLLAAGLAGLAYGRRRHGARHAA